MRMINSRAFLNDHNSGDSFVDVIVVAIAPMTAGIGFDDVFTDGPSDGASVAGIGEGMGSVAGIGACAGKLVVVFDFSHGFESSFNIFVPVFFERSSVMTPFFGFDDILSTEPLQPRYAFLTLVVCYTK